MKQLVIYHGNCIDGFTAAWCAWLKFGNLAEYYPANFGSPAPDVAGRHVLIVDFSYPRDVLLDMKRNALSLRVFDHHKTAEADIGDLEFCVFDMKRSGAGITWDELHALHPRPELVNYVEDRDLWRFSLPNTKEINAVVGSWEQDFAEWGELDLRIRETKWHVVNEGVGILRSIRRYVREMSEQARTGRLGEYSVPIVNAPYINTSELVGHLAETRDTPFAVGWFQRGDRKYAYSLRSRGDFDVSAVAKQFGGGGHKNAAGFVVAERVDR